MKIVVLFLCVLLFSCVRNPVPSEPVPAQPPVLQEFAPLVELHSRFLLFRDDDIFLRYGFTFNSPYAEWLQQVREFEQDPSMAEAARLLANLAVAARLHGVQSELYRQFEKRFDQALRPPVEQDSAEQGGVEQRPLARESVEHEDAEQKAALGAVGPSVSAPVSGFSILFSGDTQGVIFPQPGPFGNVGGLARRTSTIAFFRREDPGVVLLDAGDAFASGFERAEKINKTLVRAMNLLRYDAMGLGELDLAMGEVALRELAAMAKFPMVCSNLEFQKGVAPWIKPYVIFERNGRRIAVVSVLSVSSGAVITGARFFAPEMALGRLLPKLRSAVDFVVLLTQVGSEDAVGMLGDGNKVDVILGDHGTVSRISPMYVPAVPKGLGLGLVRLHMTAPGTPARVEAMPVLLGSDADSQLIKILDEIK